MTRHESTDGGSIDAGGATDTGEVTRTPAGERPPIDVEHAPPRLTQGIAFAALLIGALLTTIFATLAIPFGLAGIALVAAGLFTTHSRTWLSVGTALVLVGALVTGAYGAVSPAQLLVGVGATTLAWDVGQHGIGIGRQLGRRTRSTRTLVVHASTSAVIIGLISAVVYTAYLVAGGGRHASAVVTVLLGILIIVWVFRR